MSRRREAAELAIALQLSTQGAKPLPPNASQIHHRRPEIQTKPLSPSSTPLRPSLEPKMAHLGVPERGPYGRGEDEEEEDENATVADSEEEEAELEPEPIPRLQAISKRADLTGDEEEEVEVPESEDGPDDAVGGAMTAGIANTNMGDLGSGARAEVGGTVGGLLDLKTLTDGGARSRVKPVEPGGVNLPSIPSHSTIQSFTPSSASGPLHPTSISTSTSNPVHISYQPQPAAYSTPIPIDMPVPGSSSHSAFGKGPNSGGRSSPGLGPGTSAGSRSAKEVGRVELSAGNANAGESSSLSVTSTGERAPKQTEEEAWARPKPRPRIRITSDARAKAEEVADGKTGEALAVTYTPTTKGMSSASKGSAMTSSPSGRGKEMPSSPNTSDLVPTATSDPIEPLAKSDLSDDEEDNVSSRITPAGLGKGKKPVATYGVKDKEKGNAKSGARAQNKRKSTVGSQEDASSEDDFVPEGASKAGRSRSRTKANSRTVRRGPDSVMPISGTLQDVAEEEIPAKRPVRGARATRALRDTSPDPLDGCASKSRVVSDESEDEFAHYPVTRPPMLAGSGSGNKAKVAALQARHRRGDTAEHQIIGVEVEIPSIRRPARAADKASKKRRVAESSASASESDASEPGAMGGADMVIDLDDLTQPVAGPSGLAAGGRSESIPVPKDDVLVEHEDEDDFLPSARARGKKAKAVAKGKSTAKAAAGGKAKKGKAGSKVAKKEGSSSLTAIAPDIPGIAATNSKSVEKSAEFVQENDEEEDSDPDDNPKSSNAKSANIKGKELVAGGHEDAVSESDVVQEASRKSHSPAKKGMTGKRIGKRVADSDAESQMSPKKAKGEVRTSASSVKGQAASKPGHQKNPTDTPSLVLQPRAALKLNQPDRPASPSVVVDKNGNVKEFKTDRTDLPRVVSSTGGVKRMGMSRKNQIPSLHRNIKPPPKKLAAAPKKPEKQLKEGNYGSDEEPMDAFGRPIIGPDHPDYWKMED